MLLFYNVSLQKNALVDFFIDIMIQIIIIKIPITKTNELKRKMSFLLSSLIFDYFK